MPKAVVCRELGPPEHLRLATIPPAPLAQGEVRVAIWTVIASQLLEERAGNTDLILRSLRSKRLEGWTQRMDSGPSFETRVRTRSSG